MRINTLAKGIRFGLIGGLAGNIAMDIIMVGVFSMMGMPVDVFVSLIGKFAGTIFSAIGIPIEGGVLLGVVLHYFTGLLLGLIFGVAVSKIDALRLDTTKKGVALGIIFTEVLSIFLLIPWSLVLRMTASDTLRLFGMAFFFHLIFGLVLGIAVSYGLRLHQASVADSIS